MAKTDFTQGWDVIDRSTNPEDVLKGSKVIIKGGGGDEVLIEYVNFGGDYPLSQTGTYHQDDKIVAEFPDSKIITITLVPGADPKQIHAAVEHFGYPAVGEWGAEACPIEDV